MIDAASGASPEEQAATEFFTAATRNLQEMGVRAGVQRIVVVSIIGVDRFTSGYGAAKQAHERAMLAGPIPVPIVRAAQFHELVSQLIDWGGQGRVRYLPNMRTQLVAARAVAETLADVATEQESAVNGTAFLEIAGPREENLVEVARLLIARRRDALEIEATSDPADPNSALYESGALLPGPEAILAGPTFEDWLEERVDIRARRRQGGGTEMKPSIEAHGLEKNYGKTRGLDGLELKVASGEVVAVLGPNGAGKTTSIRAVATLRPADAGTLPVGGPRRRRGRHRR